MSRPTSTRRALLGATTALAAGLWTADTVAQAVDVPIRLQAELLAKVVAYDRNFAERTRGHAVVLILAKGGDAESERVAERMRAELGVLPQLGGLPHTEEIVNYSTHRSVATVCRSRGAAVLYVSLGFTEQVAAIASGLDGNSILSVAASASYVPQGAVLGFDAESGKPKLVVNLVQARRQKVAFRPELLKLARVIS